MTVNFWIANNNLGAKKFHKSLTALWKIKVYAKASLRSAWRNAARGKIKRTMKSIRIKRNHLKEYDSIFWFLN